MSQLEVDKIIPSSGTTLTIGDSGDTVNISDGTALTVDTNTLAIDQANNRVGIGISSPSTTLDVNGTITANRIVADTTTLVVDATNNRVGIGTTSPDRELTVGNVANARIGILSSDNTTGASQLQFGDTDNSQVGRIYYEHSDDSMRFHTNNTENMRIDSSGNVGIGTNSPDYKFEIETADNAIANFKSTDANANIRFTDSNSTANGYAGIGAVGDELTLIAGNDNRLRLTSSGDLVMGKTNPAFNNTVGVAIRNFNAIQVERANACLDLNRMNTNGDIVIFYRGATNVVGTISGSGSSVSYNTSSDYRLKENVIDLADATTRVKQLQPKRFNFIADADNTVDGFLAHEVSSIVPEAITGTHNEVEVWKEDEELPEGVSVGDNKLDDEGNTIPKYQGIDQSKLVPLLTASLKEALTEIDNLKARIEALENA